MLKKDLFGCTELLERGPTHVIRRDAAQAHFAVRWVARRLLAREARALAALDGVHGVPKLMRADRVVLERSYIPGKPMQEGKPTDPNFYKAAAQLLRKLHRLNVVHNDLAKEPNILVSADGSPAIIDYQLAWFKPARGRLFRILAREDIRHLLKHKRTYCAHRLTTRETQILASPSTISRIWSQTGKRIYLLVTRGILGWRDREGAGDRF
ncbi:MAG: RIO1 family regulatory kinase/ATPase [Woeseiaceae bacterium]